MRPPYPQAGEQQWVDEWPSGDREEGTDLLSLKGQFQKNLSQAYNLRNIASAISY